MEKATSKNWKRILFTSRIRTSNKSDVKTALEYIFTSVDQGNRENGTLGFLYSNPDTFNIVALLEGEETTVGNTFLQIAQDPRHTRVKRIIDARIQETEKWLQEPGLVTASQDQWANMKEKVHAADPGLNIVCQEPLDLEIIDKLPLAVDFDLGLVLLLYKSTFVTKDIDVRSVPMIMQGIVEHSQKSNEMKLIGGLLYMNTKTYEVLQCLEGPCNAVNSLFEVIRKDLRHSDVQSLGLKRVNSRKYNTWGMAWADEEARKDMLAEFNL